MTNTWSGLLRGAAAGAAAPRAPAPRAPAPRAPAAPPASVLLRAAAVGAASGSRSMSGLAALALTSTAADRGAVVSRLGGGAGTTAAAGLAAAELVADKLPVTPPRTAPPGLLPRAALGAATAAGTARRDGHDGTLAGAVGLVAALGAAVVGMRARAAAQRRLGSDLPGALVEDVLAAALAWLGTRRPGTRRS